MPAPSLTFHRFGDSVVSSGNTFSNGFGGFYPFTISCADPWITITDNASTGAALDTVAWTVAPYSGATLRSTTMVYHVASSPPSTVNQTLYQIGVPTFALSANSVTVPWTGGTVGPNILQDLTQSSDHPSAGIGAAVGWTASDPDAWVTLNPLFVNILLTTVGRPAETTSVTGGYTYTRPLSVTVAANGHASAARTSVVTVVVTSAGPGSYLDSGTLANDWVAVGLLTYTIHQDAGPDWVDPGGGGGPTPPIDGHGYKNPFNLEEGWGYYLRAGIATTGFGGADKAVCLRANKVAPYGGFDAVGVISSSTPVIDPRLAYQWKHRRLLCLYQYAGDVYLAHSDDDGVTWGGNVVLISGAKHPTIAAREDGTLIAAAYIAPTGMATYGTIKVTVQGPGEAAFGTPFTLKDHAGADILVQDDSFHLCAPPHGERLWVWVLMIGGDGGCSEWTSAEPESKSITRVT